ncbi:hypothetical protein PoB_002955900 [Plakobranchus ocellatus]|uniref:Uncharacterized protein n=1 Tax=Plakobranchus ocellatus TaxID=259542 RepID=A0AAV4A9A4_9GAST|nr:hypothetical protein PoB_002955900 [Plakobranchus ocellatus]
MEERKRRLPFLLKKTPNRNKTCRSKPRSQPNITKFQITPSFNCTLDYQVEGVDYTILELDVFGNSSRYSFKKDVWPRFEYKTRRNGKLSKATLFCTPFTIPQNGFCVTKDSFPNGCSCKHIRNDTFRLIANFSLRSQEMSHGQISLTWPGKFGPVRYDYESAEVKGKVSQNGFCVTKESFPNGCSCEQVGVDRYRLKANFTATTKEMSHGMLSLTWPGVQGGVRYDYDLPEVKTRPTREREGKPEDKSRGIRTVHILGLIQGTGVLITGGYLYFCE